MLNQTDTLARRTNTSNPIEKPFWEVKSLNEMTPAEWEALCDGCGRCCLHKLEDIDSAEIYYTRVICRFFDLEQGRCTVYTERTHLVPTCLKLDAALITQLKWIPRTCAYRRLAESQGLADWHPLVCGNQRKMQHAGISVNRKVVSEADIDMDRLEDFVVEWFD
jgi:uncharacterized protein